MSISRWLIFGAYSVAFISTAYPLTSNDSVLLSKDFNKYYELRGAFKLGEVSKLSIYNKEQKRARWVTLGKRNSFPKIQEASLEGVTLITADEQTVFIPFKARSLAPMPIIGLPATPAHSSQDGEETTAQAAPPRLSKEQIEKTLSMVAAQTAGVHASQSQQGNERQHEANDQANDDANDEESESLDDIRSRRNGSEFTITPRSRDNQITSSIETEIDV